MDSLIHIHVRTDLELTDTEKHLIAIAAQAPYGVTFGLKYVTAETISFRGRELDRDGLSLDDMRMVYRTVDAAVKNDVYENATSSLLPDKPTEEAIALRDELEALVTDMETYEPTNNE